MRSRILAPSSTLLKPLIASIAAFSLHYSALEPVDRGRLLLQDDAIEQELIVTGVASGMLGNGRVSPDGRYISFADQRVAQAGGTGNLAVWDVRTGETSIVTKFSNATPWGDGNAEDSAWIPDGSGLVYAWRVAGAESRRELRLVEVPSGEHRTVFRAPLGTSWLIPFAVSPDRLQVLVALGVIAGEGTVKSSELALIAPADGSKRTLKTFEGSLPGGGTFSPDGRFVAFDYQAQRNSTSRDVEIMPLDDTGATATIGDASTHDIVLGWLPDGRMLVTRYREGSAEAVTVQLRNGRPTGPPVVVRRTAGELRPQGVTRDGRVFLERALTVREVFIAEVDSVSGKATKPAMALAGTPPGMFRSEPAWSPVDARIAYTEWGPGTPQRVVVHDTTSGSRHVYPVDVRNIDWTRWQADGRAFIFDGTGSDNVQRTHRLWLDSGKVEPLADGLVFGVSPDGRFFYGLGSGRKWTRFGFAKDVAPVILEQPETGTPDGTTVSPDGRWFGYLIGPMRQRNVMIKPVDGGPAKILVENVAAGYARIAWTPDSRHVVFFRNPGGLHRVSIDGGAPEALGINVQGTILEKSVSLDGRRIAFGVSRNQRNFVTWTNLARSTAISSK